MESSFSIENAIMAKKKSQSGSGMSKRIQERDKVTRNKVVELADNVSTAAFKGRDISVAIPTRTRSNTIWNKKRGILQMGDGKSSRELFNLNQAKQFMQTVLHGNSIKELIDAGKTLSLRGMFYKGLHTIQGTNGEKTFAAQDESDGILEDLEVALGSLREEFHIFAENRGAMVGNITVVDKGDEIDCRRMGSGGYAIPSITESDIMQFKKIDADFVLHVEKGTVWNRFNEDRFWEEHNCILTHGGGQPPRGVRRLLQRFSSEAKLPVICLLDCDPWGHYIYSVIKQGSISLAFESERLAIPSARFLGIRAKDYEACELTDDVQIDLNDNDRKRAGEIANYPWFKDNKAWQKEIQKMVSNGFKMEVESLINRDISYVTEDYVPQRLKDEDWLD